MSVEPDIVTAAAPASDTPVALSPHDGDAYLDIVWRQFKKNRPAYFSLWLMVGLFLIAIFAPLLASNVPFVFHEGSETIYPWFQWLFHPEEPVDFFFNMALVGLVPWGGLALFTSYWSRSQGIPGRRRLGLFAVEFLAILAALIVVFSIPGVGPENSYASRDFPEEQFKSHGANYGAFALVPFGPTEQDTPSRFQPPGFRVDEKEMTKSNQAYAHLLGTVDTGQDVLARMIYGTRISMTVGLVTVSIYIVIGVIVGSLAGYFGGVIDMVISRIIEIVLLFPTFFLILTIVALVGQGIFVIMAVLGGTGWTGVARLVRGEVLKQRSLDYTLAAQALGASHTRILFRHILKNSLSPVLVSIPFGIAGAIITEAGLSLLGFGVRPPAPSWGGLLNIAHDNYQNWWLVVVPSVAIFITVTTFNLIGTGLRDAMDPRLRI
ncbi:MAG TPA: ABC transporter permease [Pirellulales bacterium]|jgi:peptide/nickel transport system permease protein|nr:ABC transporter permease [Pirellulales bacterium]